MISKIVLLYPNDYFAHRECDPLFSQEYAAATKANIRTCLFNFEEFVFDYSFKIIGQLNRGDAVVYRGWMITPEQYHMLYMCLQRRGVRMVVDPETYNLCHHLPKWYPLISDFTAETVMVSADDIIVHSEWDAVFVKDFVKSLGRDRSVARSPLEINNIIDLLKRERYGVEGGICLRHFEEFVDGSEKRIFVVNGVPYCSEGTVPLFVHNVVEVIRSPFFSIDVAVRQDGFMRVVEIGDGQVSDLKEWDVNDFVNRVIGGF